MKENDFGILMHAQIIASANVFMEICRYFWGMPKFVGTFGGLKSGLRPSPCSRQKSRYPPGSNTKR